MDSTGTLVVGGGPTGLGAAWACDRAGLDHVLVDAGTSPGGLASTVVAGGYRWDLGGHVIHSHFEEFDAAVASSGVAVHAVARTGVALTGDATFIPVPVQQQLDRIPSDIRPGAPAANLADHFRNEMGAELYETFFRPLSTKTWGRSPDDLDHTWTSLRSGSQQANVPQVGLRREAREVEHFPYPEGGSGALWAGVAAGLDLDAVRYGTRLVALDLDAQVARFDRGPDVRYDRLVSTVPLDQLCEIARDQECRRLAGRLVHTSVRLLGFGFEGEVPEALRDKTYIYSAEPGVDWLRATVLSNYSPSMAPPGCWNVLFEVSAPASVVGADVDRLAGGCLDSLVALGADLRRLERRWTRFLEYGYPVPTLDRDATLRPLLSRLESKQVLSRGRFGGWRYESCNQDYSFAQGVEAVVSGTDDVLWRPGEFTLTKEGRRAATPAGRRRTP
jgi:protoporphyrinogen oxidase